MRILKVTAAAACLALACIGCKTQTESAPSAPATTSATSTSSASAAPVNKGCTVNNEPATCGVVRKTIFKGGGAWGTMWSELNLIVTTDAGERVDVKADMGDSAEELHKTVSVGDRVAYVLGKDGDLDSDDIKF